MAGTRALLTLTSSNNDPIWGKILLDSMDEERLDFS
jgi:hypothetical protein